MTSLDFVDLLRNSGLKVTPQRLSVLKLMSRGGHYSGEQLFQELKRTEPSISLSTVYNTLEALTQAGILNAFEANGITWYEVRKEDHVNVVCIDSGEIVDAEFYPEDLVKSLQDKGFSVKSLKIVAYAECKKLDQQNR